MSDPEAPQPEKPRDLDDVVDSANAGLADAEAAAAEVPGPQEETPEDPDAAAFAEAEKAFPGTFSAGESAAVAADDATDSDAAGDATTTDEPGEAIIVDETAVVSDETPAETPGVSAPPAVATAAYAAGAARDAETQVVPAEPVFAPAPQPQPIFVQAPEPPDELGNRGTAGAIGLLAALSFAILSLGSTLALGAIEGKVTGETFTGALIAPLTTWVFWVPVVTFYLAFWLLGAIINRGRWGYWVVFGLVVGAAAYGGVLLGRLFEAPFFMLSPAQGVELVQSELLSPLAIAAFLFGRELTIWFGAWVARSGARKTELNAQAQREYERTLEAGPSIAR